MKKLTSLILLAVFIVGSFALTGCMEDPDESTIPWSRPQDWEGGIPGLGAGG